MPETSGSYVQSQEPVESDWFLIHCKPGRERLAFDNLRRQSYELYFPELLCRVRKHDGWAERIAPLFPRYLFVRVDSGTQSMAPVRSTTGVSCIVRFGTDYAQVPARVIAALRGRADSRTGLHRLIEPPSLVPGVRVRIVSGIFDGLDGVFQRESGEDRVVVLLDLLGKSAPVRLPATCVMSAARTFAQPVT